MDLIYTAIVLIIILNIISSVVILSLVPIEDKNKLLDKIEIKAYTKKQL
ncbi:accessory gene regulator B family protein [uncultured Tyzzerella sp.]|nr:accessory gene regulator B family protein [uncultured Tyzzerella sp.]